MILLEQGRAHCQQCRIHVLKFNFSRIFFFGGSRIYNTKQDGYKWSTQEISNCSLSIIYPCVLEYHFNMPIKKYYTVCCLSGILYCYLLVFKIIKNPIHVSCNKDICTYTLCCCHFCCIFQQLSGNICYIVLCDPTYLHWLEHPPFSLGHDLKKNNLKCFLNEAVFSISK